MDTTHRALLIALVVFVAGPQSGFAQTEISAPPASASLSPPEMEKFLLAGRIVKKKESSKGVTSAFRVTLSDGALTHDAQVQNVDIARPLFEVGPKYTEVNFKDSYRYNIAAYRLAGFLGLDNVPMSVERNVEGKPAAVTWWLDEVMDEGDRKKKNLPHANSLRAVEYFSLMYVFDELIQNRDRNAGNIVWGRDSKMWFIDHTRAFRVGRDLLTPANLTRIERKTLEKLRTLDRAAFTSAVGNTLTKDEIDALFIRRDKIVQLFDQKIATLGEEKVFYTIH